MTTFSFDGQRVYDHIKHLSVDIGPRMRGSDGEKRAADYIRSHFESLGLEIQEQTFDIEHESLIDHKVEILEPPLGEIPSVPLLLTPDTPEEGLTGELVLVEGSQEPQVGPHVTGKIVLWSCSPISAFNRRELIKHRPRAVIAIWPVLGVKPKPAPMVDRDPVTSLWITWEDGLRLVRAGAKKARLHLRTERRRGTSRNVIAELKGSKHPEEIIVIGGHYDSHSGGPAAADNAAGIATAMELARLYAQRGPKRTLRFAAWGAETGGFIGSVHYLEELKRQDKEERASDGFVEGRDKTQLDRHLFYLNLDALGMPLGHNSCYVLGPPELTATIDILSKELGVPHQVKEGPDACDASDHEPFAWAGVPAIGFLREGPALTYIHMQRPNDNIDMIDVAQLQRIGAFLDTFLTRTAAEAQVWPFERWVPDNLAKNVDRKDLMSIVVRVAGWSMEEKGA